MSTPEDGLENWPDDSQIAYEYLRSKNVNDITQEDIEAFDMLNFGKAVDLITENPDLVVQLTIEVLPKRVKANPRTKSSALAGALGLDVLMEPSSADCLTAVLEHMQQHYAEQLKKVMPDLLDTAISEVIHGENHTTELLEAVVKHGIWPTSKNQHPLNVLAKRVDELDFLHRAKSDPAHWLNITQKMYDILSAENVINETQTQHQDRINQLLTQCAQKFNKNRFKSPCGAMMSVLLVGGADWKKTLPDITMAAKELILDHPKVKAQRLLDIATPQAPVQRKAPKL